MLSASIEANLLREFLETTLQSFQKLKQIAPEIHFRGVIPLMGETDSARAVENDQRRHPGEAESRVGFPAHIISERQL